MIPQRIQLSRAKGWRMPENTVKVDRSTPYGNPFTVRPGTYSKMGKTEPKFFISGPGFPLDMFDTKPEALEHAVKRFRAYIAHPANSKLRAMVMLLRGKNLGCWCKPGAPCHADVLLEIANS